MSPYDPLNQLRHLGGYSPNFHDRANDILYGEEYKQWVSYVWNDDFAGIVNDSGKTLDTLDPTNSTHLRSLCKLRHICGTRTILPTPCTFLSRRSGIGPRLIASGGSGDVYEGTLNGSKIRIKCVRVYSEEDPMKTIKALYQEAIARKRLEHRNVVPFPGITSSPDRLHLLSDVANGLYYLHSCNIVRGNLKGLNILVDAVDHARTADFGCSAVVEGPHLIQCAMDCPGYAVQWAPPEIAGGDGTYSKKSDVFSFAVVVIEVLTSAAPFNDCAPVVAMEVIIDDKLSQRERREAQEAAKRTKVARELERIKIGSGQRGTRREEPPKPTAAHDRSRGGSPTSTTRSPGPTPPMITQRAPSTPPPGGRRDECCSCDCCSCDCCSCSCCSCSLSFSPYHSYFFSCWRTDDNSGRPDVDLSADSVFVV